MLPGIFRQLERRLSDQSTREEAWEEALRYRELIAGIARQAKLGLWEFDETTQTEIYLSPEFSQYLQIIQSIPDIPGHPKSKNDQMRGIHPEDWNRYLEETETQIQRQGWWDVEYRADTHSEQIIWLREIGKMIKDSGGLPTRSFGIIQDITELRKVDQIKSEFVSTVSHELRTPLTSIKGSLGLIRSGVTGDMTAQTKSLIDIAYRNCDQLVLLINDLLDIEKFEIDDMKIDMAPIQLPDLMNEAVEMYQGYGEERAVTFVIKGKIPTVSVEGDKNRLLQLLANLMSNAAKFSPDGGDVELAAEITEDFVHVTVRDYGSGIPVEFRDRVFDKFTQADSSDARQIGGSGLGLSIAKRIVESHGGTIDFESEEGKGTTFAIGLPYTV